MQSDFRHLVLPLQRGDMASCEVVGGLDIETFARTERVYLIADEKLQLVSLLSELAKAREEFLPTVIGIHIVPTFVDGSVYEPVSLFLPRRKRRRRPADRPALCSSIRRAVPRVWRRCLERIASASALDTVPGSPISRIASMFCRASSTF